MADIGGIGEIGGISGRRRRDIGVTAEAARVAAPAAAAAAAFRSNQETVFVDVGARRIDANVVRDGLPIGSYAINQDILDDIIVAPPVRFTIVGQSVPAGTPVPVGTAIDIVLARPGSLPIGVVTGVHSDLVQLTINEGFQRFVAGRPQVRRIVARAGAGALTPEDEQAVVELFQSQDIAIEDVPGRDVGAAVETLRTLTTFGG